MRWQRRLATFAECQLNGFANCRAVDREPSGPDKVARQCPDDAAAFSDELDLRHVSTLE
jgi:hypothetical protein